MIQQNNAPNPDTNQWKLQVIATNENGGLEEVQDCWSQSTCIYSLLHVQIM